MKTLLKLREPHEFIAAKAATITVCALILGYGGFLLFHSGMSGGGGATAQNEPALQGQFTIVTDGGATCYRTFFDNRSSFIVGTAKGACRERTTADAALDSDGPLGSIRKALNGK
jgi:hypothetical protein